MKKENTRNGFIDVCRILFCIMIVCFHSKIIVGKHDFCLFRFGSIAVEFFFIVSGLFFASKIDHQDKDIYKSNVKSTLERFARFFPYIAFSVFVSILVEVFFNEFELKHIVFSIGDISMLSQSGIVEQFYNGPLWYISSLLLSQFILYPIIKNNKEKWYLYRGPILFLLGTGFVFMTQGHLRGPHGLFIFIKKGLLRGILEITLGTLVYYYSKIFKSLKLTKFSKLMLTFIAIGCIAFPFFISQFYKYEYDAYVIMAIAAGLFIVSSQQTMGLKVFNNKFCYYLGRISLPMFTFQRFVIDIVKNGDFFAEFSYLTKIVIILGSLIIISVIFESCKSLIKSISLPKRIKHFLIRD